MPSVVSPTTSAPTRPYAPPISDNPFNLQLPSFNTNMRPTLNLDQLEVQIHDGINAQRRQNNLPALSYDSNLAFIARAHSKDMAAKGYFAHDNQEGLDPSARAKNSGYNCYKTYAGYYTTGIAENIFQNNLYSSIWYTNGVISSYDWNSQEQIAESTVTGWMNSPGHRANILTSTYDREGIGIAVSSDDKVYITENFC